MTLRRRGKSLHHGWVSNINTSKRKREVQIKNGVCGWGSVCAPPAVSRATVNTMVNAWLCQLWYLYWFTTVALGLSRHQNPWEGLLKSRSLGLPSFPYSSIGIVVGVGAQELDISHKIPADIATAGPGLPLWGPLAQVAVSLMMLCQSPKR